MAITLAEAKVGMANKVDQQVVDEFRRASLLLDNLTFDDTISPGTGGSTLTYGYVQLQTPSTAAVRAINNEYTANEAKRIEKTSKAIIMGGSFEVDRVLQNTSGAINELAFQASEKIKATANYFHYLAINGSSKATADTGYVHGTFDGLKKHLAGKSTELTSTVDISTSANMDANYQAFLDELDALVASVAGGASMLMMNKAMLGKVRSIARRAGYFESDRNEFGKIVEYYNGIPLVDLGTYYNGTNEVDVVETATGKTAIYAANLGLNAFHGISPLGGKVINSYMPDLNAPGAVKKGEVELVCGVVLKNTKAAAVLKDITI